MVLTNIRNSGYIRPRKMQGAVMPLVKSKRDLKVQSETGSGKTAAFLIPIIDEITKEKLNEGPGRQFMCTPRCIVLETTHEMADQAYEQAKKFAHNTGVSVARCYGGYTESINEIDLRQSRPDILISTLGRLEEFVEKGRVVFDRLKRLVLDDADRLFGTQTLHEDTVRFVENVKYTSAAQKNELQIMMFSATFSDKMNDLAIKLLNDDFGTVTNERPNHPNLHVEQTFEHFYSENEKIFVFSEFCKELSKRCIEDNKKSRVLAFVNRRSMAEEVKDYFNKYAPEIKCEAFTSRFDQKEREKVLSKFREAVFQVIIATDVSAYGLDIKFLDHVVNYNLPPDTLTYVQRIGRTGRLGVGKAHSYFHPVIDRRIVLKLIEMFEEEGKQVPVTLLEKRSS